MVHPKPGSEDHPQGRGEKLGSPNKLGNGKAEVSLGLTTLRNRPRHLTHRNTIEY